MMQYVTWDENGRLNLISENGKIVFYNKNTYIIDKYGNTLTIDDIKAVYQQNSPTYDELYEHWLKTKQND